MYYDRTETQLALIPKFDPTPRSHQFYRMITNSYLSMRFRTVLLDIILFFPRIQMPLNKKPLRHSAKLPIQYSTVN